MLEGANVDVVGGDLRVEHHQHVPVVLDRRRQLRVGGLDRAANAPEEVHLPGGAEPGAVEVPGSAAERAQHLLRELGTLVEGVAVDAREPLAHGDSSPGHRLGDAFEGLAELQAALPGALDQPHQHRILEHGPPGVETRVTRREAAHQLLVPGVGRLDRRLLVVGADCAASDRQQTSQAKDGEPPDLQYRERCHLALQSNQLRTTQVVGIAWEALLGARAIRTDLAEGGRNRLGQLAHQVGLGIDQAGVALPGQGR